MAIEKDARILILDTETTNNFDDPLCYDVGYEVFDLAGNLYDRNSFINADVFFAKELMASAFFLDKFDQYVAECDAGKRQLASWFHITKQYQQAEQPFHQRIEGISVLPLGSSR